MTEQEEIKQAIQEYRDGNCANFSNKQFIKWLESLQKENEKLRSRLEAKLIFINNGNEDQRWYQQEQQTALIESQKAIIERALTELRSIGDSSGWGLRAHVKRVVEEIKKLQERSSQ